jgi:hypothetical protein
MRVSRDAVDFISESLQSAYETKRLRGEKLPTAFQADHRIELAGWCVRHRLFEAALGELEKIPDARRSDVRIRVLQRQIAIARQVDKAELQESYTLPPSVPINSISEQRSAEIEAILANVSATSLADYTKNVQRRLLHGCASSGCHDHASETSFKLACDSPSRPVSRGMTISNLAACYELLDKENVTASRLLEYVSRPHGGQNVPVYRIGSNHYDAIFHWAQQSIRLDDSQLSISAAAEQFGQVQTASAEMPVITASTDQQYTDPFDPEVFNRWYRARQSAIQRNERPSEQNPSPGSFSVPEIKAPSRLSENVRNSASPAK